MREKKVELEMYAKAEGINWRFKHVDAPAASASAETTSPFCAAEAVTFEMMV